MKTDFYVKLQKKFGGMWVATSKKGDRIYAANQDVESLYKKLAQKKIKPQTTVIGFIEKPKSVHVYMQISLPHEKHSTWYSR